MKPHSILVSLGLSMLGVLGSACSSDSGSDDDVGTVEIFSWWTAEGERQALDAMLEVYTQDHPGTTIINAAVQNGDNAEAALAKRLADGRPPDAFQTLTGNKLLEYVKGDKDDDELSIVERLDDLADEGNWLKNMPESVIEGVSFNGHVYGVPVNVERNNAIFYNKKIFDKYDLSPPETMEEFWVLADKLVAEGVTPISIGAKDNWTIIYVMWYWVGLQAYGPDYYLKFLSGEQDPLDPEFRDIVEQTVRIFDYSSTDGRDYDWDGAAEKVFEGEAAMTVMGDWAKGFLKAKKWKPGVDFDEFVPPGTQDYFVFSNDVFVLPKGAPNEKGARGLLDVFGSVAGQDAFNLLKGSIPVRTDADKSLFDVISKRTIEDFAVAELVPSTAKFINPEFEEKAAAADGELFDTHDIDQFIADMVQAYDTLK